MIAPVLIVALCLILNAMLAATEMAFVSVGRAELRLLANRGVKRANTLLLLKNNPERILSVIQIGITLVGAIAAAVSGAGAEESLSPLLMEKLKVDEPTAEGLSIALIVLPLTYLNVVFGELIPKSISLKRPTRIALASALWLKLSDRALSPLISVLEKSTKLVLNLIGLKAEAPMIAEDEFVEVGNLSQRTKQYVLNTISAERKRAQDVMVPWSGVNFVRHDDSLATVREIALQSRHTRLPVMTDDHVTGLIHTKEFLSLSEAGVTNWTEQIRPILRYRSGEPILNILQQMQEKRSHIAAVYDRMTVIGIVTLEDIVEEIVGDLFDEDDDGRMRRFYGRLKK